MRDAVIGGAVGQIGEQSGNTTRWAALAGGYVGGRLLQAGREVDFLVRPRRAE
jgi:uncharacterized protein YcfJ